MSAETMEWLNTYTLIGFTEKRGNAWHYAEALQGDEPNHYPDAIPYDDVTRRLFNFTVDESPIYTRIGPRFQKIDGRKAMVRSDNGHVLGIFKEGYTGHQYQEWLMENVRTILGDGLSIGSAGLLRMGAQGWVSVEVPENVTTPEGFTFRPNLLAATSFDGSLATTYKRVVTAVVCDNTLAAGLAEDGETYKLKHSKYSALKIADARDALEIVYRMADDFAAEVKRLTAWKVSEDTFFKHLNAVVPLPLNKTTPSRALTVATKKQEEIIHLYRDDERAASWRGTALGVLQAHNTWNQHNQQVRKGVSRKARNMENLLSGKTEAADSNVLQVLAAVA